MTDDATIAFQNTDAYQVAKALAVAVHRARIRDAELRDQAGRALQSAFLQLSEGLPNDSLAMRRKYFRLRAGQNAHVVRILSERRRGRGPGLRNSVCEVVAAIDLAVEIDAVEVEVGREIIRLAARLRALLQNECAVDQSTSFGRRFITA